MLLVDGGALSRPFAISGLAGVVISLRNHAIKVFAGNLFYVRAGLCGGVARLVCVCVCAPF